jgi:AcrR family transcriptional regulator
VKVTSDGEEAPVATASVDAPAATDAPDSAERSNGPRSRRGARSRARLLEAAKEIFEEDGFLDARINDIAKRAGLSQGSFYYYFDSKEEIFREVAVTVDDQLSAPLGDVILAPSHVPAQDRIREAIERHFDRYRAEARIMGVIEEVSRYDAEVSAMRLERHGRYAEQVSESIRQLQRRRLADPELDPVIAAGVLGALTYRFAEMWLVQGAVECEFDVAVDQVARLFVNALGLPEAPSHVAVSTSSSETNPRETP